ncbi:uncharacterized protein EDB91DRAFT_1335002 [Suillus paluster]|uniref:uncharacterized protein n=1 Tax=Suillus paluster TaxID=48578 RepID=UPI001B887258|nr:uncharacterized protein EDB91DRAFT_1335002 [Suillus paluster]KAG1746569.1 hypothetical protein EDB91DRAFT_1335002 [Suillus paluster]
MPMVELAAKDITFKIALAALAISASTYFVNTQRAFNGILTGTLEGSHSADLCPRADEIVLEKDGVIWDSGLRHMYESFHLLSRYSRSKLELTKVNTYGRLYVWKGSDSVLKPLLVAVTKVSSNMVPVLATTIEEYQHPPFSGYSDDLGETLGSLRH